MPNTGREQFCGYSGSEHEILPEKYKKEILFLRGDGVQIEKSEIKVLGNFNLHGIFEYSEKDEKNYFPKSFINEEEFAQEDLDVVQEYIDDHEISEAQARSFLERFGLSQAEIDAAVAKFQFNQ